jgi:hypothetical protein
MPAAEVAEHLHRAAEGGLVIYQPVLPVHSPQELIKLLWIRQGGSQPRTEDSFAPIEAFQTSAELATKHAAEDFHWQKEAWTFPMAVVRRQPASWAGAVNIRMKQQILPPGMQNADQADLCARVFRVRRHRHQGLCVFAINTWTSARGKSCYLKWEEVELESGIIKMLV